jgi:hypothetical protein
MRHFEEVNGTLKEIDTYIPQPHFLTYIALYSHQHYRGADKSLARPRRK